MPGFTHRPYRQVLAVQCRGLLGSIPDAITALILVAAIGCACVALEPSEPGHRTTHPVRVVAALLQH